MEGSVIGAKQWAQPTAQAGALAGKCGRSHTLLVGQKVGAGRWPYASSHPGAWLPPWCGELLDRTDPRAWTETLAFSGVPTAEEIRAHLVYCDQNRLLDMHVPVLWNFGKDGARTYWERSDSLKPVEIDAQEWAVARMSAYAALEQAAQASTPL